MRERWRPIYDDRNVWIATAEPSNDGSSWDVFIGTRKVGNVGNLEAAAALVARVRANEEEAR